MITSSITAPLERQFGQMPGLNQMSSASSGGASVITLQFSLELPLDVAEQEVQAAINAAGTFLPADLPQPPIYNKVNPADTPIVTLALTSRTMPLPEIQYLADTRLAAKISQLPGVGLVSISGGQRPAVRIQANPKALAAYNLSLDDLRTAIGNANSNQAKGSFDGPTRASTIDANDQLQSADEFKSMIVAYRNGAPVRLADVADVVDGAENTRLAAWANESAAVIVNIQRQPGANVIEVVDRIKRLLPQLSASLPAAVDVVMLTDRTVTIRASVRDVQFELLLAVALVVMIIFLFLRNVAATVIPSVAVPLSLVGTFAVMYLAGFSINNLTLMALTIATGFVVDDAIVMIENITRYIEEGEPPLAAALKGAEQIGFTIISLTLSLIAVLIPLLFMGDVVGRLFREFAITLAVAILISAVVSLTLTPMMCARLLRHVPERGAGPLLPEERRMVRPGDRALRAHADVGARPPGRDAARGDRHAGAHHRAVHRDPQGLLPGPGHRRDPGHFGGLADDFLRRDGRAPAGAGEGDPAGPGGGEPVVVHRRRRQQPDAEQRPLPDQPEAARAARAAAPPTSSGACRTTLAARRGHRALHAAGAGPHHRGQGEPHAVPVLGGGRECRRARAPGCRSSSRGCAQDRRLVDVASDQQEGGLQAYVDIDRAAASRYGITPAMIDNALYNAFGQRLVSTIFTQTNQYRVVLEVQPEFRKGLAALDSIYVNAPNAARGRRGRPARSPGARRRTRRDAADPAVGAGAGDRAHRAAGREPHRPVSGGHDFVQPRARRIAGRRGEGRSRRRSATSACRRARR